MSDEEFFQSSLHWDGETALWPTTWTSILSILFALRPSCHTSSSFTREQTFNPLCIETHVHIFPPSLHLLLFQSSLHWDYPSHKPEGGGPEKISFNPLCIETVHSDVPCFLSGYIFQSSLHWDGDKGYYWQAWDISLSILFALRPLFQISEWSLLTELSILFALRPGAISNS